MTKEKELTTAAATEQPKEYLKIDKQLLATIVNVIAQSQTQLTFVQQQQLFEEVQKCEPVK